VRGIRALLIAAPLLIVKSEHYALQACARDCYRSIIRNSCHRRDWFDRDGMDLKRQPFRINDLELMDQIFSSSNPLIGWLRQLDASVGFEFHGPARRANVVYANRFGRAGKHRHRTRRWVSACDQNEDE
jgi:hypothetical protein